MSHEWVVQWHDGHSRNGSHECKIKHILENINPRKLAFKCLNKHTWSGKAHHQESSHSILHLQGKLSFHMLNILFFKFRNWSLAILFKFTELLFFGKYGLVNFCVNISPTGNNDDICVEVSLSWILLGQDEMCDDHHQEGP